MKWNKLDQKYKKLFEAYKKSHLIFFLVIAGRQFEEELKNNTSFIPSLYIKKSITANYSIYHVKA